MADSSSQLGKKLSLLEHHDWSGGVFRSTLSADEVGTLVEAVRQAFAIAGDIAVERRFLAFITRDGLKYPASTNELHTLSSSSTAVLQGLEGINEMFDVLRVGLKSDFHPKVSFSAYFSSVESHKLGMHQDKWDGIIIQLLGSKVFFLESGKIEKLASGDVLLLPQDVRHDVATDCHSLHLSIVLLRGSWMRSEGWTTY